MTMPRPLFARSCAALMLLTLLPGCVAAFAVPLMTATGMLTQKKRTRAEVVAALPAANSAALAAAPAAETAGAGPAVRLTGLTELPPPSGGIPGIANPWRDFASYTVNYAARLAQGGEAISALLTPESVASFRARMRTCNAREPAVVVDLDPGTATFDPALAAPAPPEVTATLAQLRDAGVIVLWVSQASANAVAGVAAALQASGLDPSGRDPILLVRNADERKQVLREEANQTVCVVAMAGDRRGDFDELFDYLRDPRLATAYDGQIGAGWFIVPPLFEPGSVVAPAGEDGGR